MAKYRTILADPPWKQEMAGRYDVSRHKRPTRLPYPTMSIDTICSMPVQDLAAEDAHLWLWTTNAFLHDAFHVMDEWGFKYLSTITWVKPSGLGNYFISRTQHLLFGYKGKCRFPMARYRPTVINAVALRHSAKPEESYELVESVSPSPRLELFARQHRLGWDVWGNEVESNIDMGVVNG